MALGLWAARALAGAARALAGPVAVATEASFLLVPSQLALRLSLLVYVAVPGVTSPL